MSDEDFAVVEQHTIDGLDGSISRLVGLVVDIAIALRVTLLIGDNFAGQNIAESSKRVVKRLKIETLRSLAAISEPEFAPAHLVINRLVKVLDEDVALASLTESGVTLRPHDAAVPTHSQHAVHAPPKVASIFTMDGP